jgi:hypothetical protein
MGLWDWIGISMWMSWGDRCVRKIGLRGFDLMGNGARARWVSIDSTSGTAGGSHGLWMG